VRRRRAGQKPIAGTMPPGGANQADGSFVSARSMRNRTPFSYAYRSRRGPQSVHSPLTPMPPAHASITVGV
jgi:hypothetical protein